MNESFDVKIRKQVARQQFDSFTSRQKALHCGMDEKPPDDSQKNILIGLGDAKFAANSPIRGQIRCMSQLHIMN